jgi:hypothetical protein
MGPAIQTLFVEFSSHDHHTENTNETVFLATNCSSPLLRGMIGKPHVPVYGRSAGSSWQFRQGLSLFAFFTDVSGAKYRFFFRIAHSSSIPPCGDLKSALFFSQGNHH